MPVYVDETGRPGRQVWWEQRVVIRPVGTDGVSFRKQERKRSVWAGIERGFALREDDFGIPGGGDGSPGNGTPLLSTCGLLAWLCTRMEMA